MREPETQQHRHTPVDMEETSSFPTIVAWAEYHEEGTNSGAVAAQLDIVGTVYPDAALEWAEQACKAVAFPCCNHTSCPPGLTGSGTLKQRKEEAAAHPGLCGVHHAEFIAGVKFADVLERAGSGGVVTSKGFRNQASSVLLCYTSTTTVVPCIVRVL